MLEAFRDPNYALSVVDLVQRFQDDMNKTTVYRILERLEEEQILHSFTGKDGLKWVAKRENADAAEHNHAHFQCEDCGKSECLKVEIPIPPVPNHKVRAASLIIVGQCKDCLN